MSQTHARRARRAGAAVLAAAALLLAGCSGGDGSGKPSGDSSKGGTQAGADAPPLQPLSERTPAALRPYYDQKLSWRSCGMEGFECATLRVPLDYGKPGKGPRDTAHNVKLALARTKPQAGQGRPEGGSLHVNPGGPGGSAIAYLQQQAALAYPPRVREHYSLVGMDPRGVGRSEPVECLGDRQMDAYTRVDQTPDDKKEAGALSAAYGRFAEGCRKRSGKLLGHVSTAEAARDMDVLRAALGDKKLNYVGASYGTYLGATYAGLFPHRSGRLVLDGAMDPSLDARRVNREQTAGFETAFKAFARDCVGQSDCPLGTGSVREAGRRLNAFFAKVDREPLKTDSSRTLTESLATTGVIRAMYDEGSWPALRQALAAGRKGDGTPLLELSDDYYERGPDGSYSNTMFANPAVNCLDAPPAFDDEAEAREAVPSFEKASPVFGRGFAWAALNCASWPVDPTGEPHRIAAKGADPILVVGTTRDPATPYRWAQGLAGQLSSGRLLTYKGDGHTAYLRGSDCVDRAVSGYLVQGKPPKDGTTCR
ncbi:alpha/beta hydrolase [Streptomyces albus subsp. chlorinus]|uniref:alpha/beta hydrolase n=1 Tax=Streptomyces albus TaxID=1888 RepID=UPI00156E818C|nr:alpha/beta hydrolase [Streptomyces albus]NSC23112.1 alpha/beta hydrolase [Streptomyces albus subsp. chlorinus]